MSSSPHRPVIMVVDDSAVHLRTAKMFLEPTFQVIQVPDGFSALAAVQDARPDLLLLDLEMPRLGGFDVCQMIRANPDFEQLPIIMLSSKDSPFDRVRGELLGCNAYVSKPFNKVDLLETVRQQLQQAQSARGD